ncbi:uncharacterized protein PV09_02307 [Verruconis gallopava]|uniref:Chitin-binding type-4 domain-containing protein n=1 Tax=Verruconis gallopava TaxID=253628 RepID=A0A0D1XUZ5_9PEZI|nr:uncharacterized protein PV09_02307 [Verruconis gallopava]KIW06591.1 hypothetical protein PV09_02307 [Verruconis gallopava]
MKTFNHLPVIAVLVTSASAHISMSQPVPYDSNKSPPTTSPLDASGANYPCQGTQGSFSATSSNTAAVGSTFKMSFSGTAVHNGGSCQVSLTTDGASALNPNTKFKVIYSMLGGCPGLNGATVSYDVPVPSEVPAGDYTLAWTWFNNIGNREMYMNCAPMTITGGSGTNETFDALPDMAVYNIASKNSCKTVETFDVDFPNPGKYTTKGASFKPQAPTCDGTDLGTGSGGSGSSNTTSGTTGGSSGSNGSATSSANNGQYTGIGAGGSQGSATSSATPSASSGPNSGSSPQVQAPGAASSSATTTASVVQSSAAAATTAAGGTNGTFSSPSPSTGSSTSSGTACSQDGVMICSADGSQFGLCNHGSAIMMPVAAGTKCVNGAIQKRRRDIPVKIPFPFKG